MNTHTHESSQSFTAPHSSAPAPSSSSIPAPHYSETIHEAADHLIHLFNTEISQEFQATCAYLKAERAKIFRERNEIKQEREGMKRERENRREGRKWIEDFAHVSSRLKEEEISMLKVENQALKVRIQALQVGLGNSSTWARIVEGSQAEP
jgi:hypothetical protein